MLIDRFHFVPAGIWHTIFFLFKFMLFFVCAYCMHTLYRSLCDYGLVFHICLPCKVHKTMRDSGLHVCNENIIIIIIIIGVVIIGVVIIVIVIVIFYYY